MTARTVEIPAIKAAVARVFGVSVAAIDGHRRTAEIARARQCAMWLTRQLTQHVALTAIGIAFERDHSTVLHALVRVDRLRRSDPALGRRLEEICGHLGHGAPLQAAALRARRRPQPRRVGAPAAGAPIRQDRDGLDFRRAAARGAEALLARLRARYPAGAP